MSLAQQILLQIILIAINAFFAATEIAVVSLNTTKLKKMAEDGDKYAPKLLKMAENPTSFLSTIQIGITLAGFLGSAFAADNLAVYIRPLFEKIAFREDRPSHRCIRDDFDYHNHPHHLVLHAYIRRTCTEESCTAEVICSREILIRRHFRDSKDNAPGCMAAHSFH